MKCLSNQKFLALSLGLALSAQTGAWAAARSHEPSLRIGTASAETAPLIALTTGSAESRKTVAEDAMNDELDRLTNQIKNKPVAQSLFRRATIYLAKPDMKAAIADLEQSIKLDPSNVDATELLVDCYMQSGEANKSRALLEAFLQKYPENDSAWATLSFVQASTNDLKEAIASIDRAIELAPKSAAHYKSKAAIYARINDYKKVVEVVEQGLKKIPNDEILLFSKAYADETMLGDNKLALKEINDLIAQKPDFLRAYQERAKIELAQGELLAAKTHDQELLELIAKKEAELGKITVDQVVKEKNILAGAGTVAKSIALLQLRASTLSDKAETEVRLSQLDDAYKDALDASNRVPRKAAYKSQLGAICFHLGRFDEAKTDFEAALQIDPRQTVAPFYLGYMYLLDGKYDQASHSFTSVIEDKSFQNVLYGYVYRALSEKLKGTSAQDIKKTIAEAKLDMSKWPCPLLGLIDGTSSAKSLIDQTKENGQATELHFVLAFLALAEHDNKQCKAEFEWIKANGSPLFIESATAKQWLSRQPAGAPS